MTADEYLTILAEVDAELADELRTNHMVLVCVLNRASKSNGNALPLFYERYERIDREMDARLEWFK